MRDQLKAAGLRSNQAEALIALLGGITDQLAQQADVAKLDQKFAKLNNKISVFSTTMTLLIAYLTVELGSKPDSVINGSLDLVKGLNKGGGG